MSTRIKILILVPLLAIIIGGGIGYYMYNKPHVNLRNSEADYQLTIAQLLQAFSDNEADANTKYLNKIIQVSGTVAERESTETGDVIVFLKDPGEMFGVSCAFVPEQKEEAESLITGDEVTIRGICSGMLMDVSLSRCIVVTP